ncbi:hypothetical protein BD779DRAFT_1428527, partial [Infundibulicybe gibba]
VPMRSACLAAMAAAWAWGVAAGGLGLNALIKSNQDQSRLKKQAPPPTVVNISVHDIFAVGVVATTVSALVAFLLFNYAGLLFLRPALAARTLRLQSFSIFFCSVWLLAAQIPFTIFYATRAARVTAFVGTVQLPDTVIKSVEKTLGTSSVYRQIPYLRAPAIIPWITLISFIAAASVLLVASRRVPIDS